MLRTNAKEEGSSRVPYIIEMELEELQELEVSSTEIDYGIVGRGATGLINDAEG